MALAQRDMGTLGVRSTKAIKEEMDQVNAALDRLKRSSSAAGTDLARATQAAKVKMSELKAEMSGTVSASDQLRDAWGQLAGLVAGLAAFGTAAREAIQFESALVDLRRAAGVTSDEAREMGKEFQDLAVKLGMSAVAITQLATEAAKTGVAKRDLLEFSRIAATAAMNFDMLPEEAGNALAKLKNILGLGVKDMEAFVATLNELADNAATSERDIIEALKLGGGSAIQFGLTARSPRLWPRRSWTWARHRSRPARPCAPCWADCALRPPELARPARLCSELSATRGSSPRSWPWTPAERCSSSWRS